ncbi:MAG TPA: DEAD/DEAH box helicase, partial [Dermatophilaceae bacterium]|nr:DEAD/DEAH box helicase [Dermatophilaceae bacterium]
SGPKKPHRGQAPTESKPPRSERAPRHEPRSGSSDAGTSRYAARSRDERPARDARGERPSRFERDDRVTRPTRSARFDRDDRPARPAGFSRDDRATRPARFERDDRPARPAGFDRDERPRRFDRDERPARPTRFDRDERPRRFERDERPARPTRFDKDERPRRFDRDERPRRFEREGERPAYREPFVDPESERLAADSWTSSARTPVSTGPVTVAEDNGFAALDLPERLVERLARDGITTPFPIQDATIPDALAGRDVLGRGQTGSGKTLAFGLPMLARLSADGSGRVPRRPRALVLVPTRELAMQVSDALEPLVHVLGMRHKLVAGGLSYTTQINALERGIDLLIATPGRLIDLLDRGAVELGSVKVTVLDEADHMAEMGFMPEVTRILDDVPGDGQRLLFSATLDNGVDQLVQRYLTDPVTHSTDDVSASVTTMRHFPFLIDPQHKKPITAELANRPGRTLVFVRTKLGADRVAAQLRELGVVAAALHGGLSQGVRNRVLGAFRLGTLRVLVATDVAARGIHVDDVSLVLQVDPPADHKDYLHRSGRTARAGEEGSVVTLVLPHQRKQTERLLKEAGLEEVPTRVAPGDRLVAAAGGSTPTGEPVTDEAMRRLLEPERRGPAGARGPRHGSHGGFRPHHGGAARRDDRREDRRNDRRPERRSDRPDGSRDDRGRAPRDERRSVRD